MKSFTAIAVAATLATTVSAQQVYAIDPNSVSNGTKLQWCTSQTTACPLICLDETNSAETIANQCDQSQLTYACVCNNGLSPNVSEYSQTLPFYLCQEWGTQCVSNCGLGNNDCANDCRANHPCGAQNPTRQNTSTLSKTMSRTASGTGADATATGADSTDGVYSGFAGASSTGSSGGSDSAAASASAGGAPGLRAAALNAGQTFGLLGVVGLLFGGFAVLL